MPNMIIEPAMTKCEGKTGWSVRITYRPPMEDMFETITHKVVFRFEHEARVLAKRVSEAISKEMIYPLQAIDISQWLWQPTKASPLGFMHKAPEAQPVYREGKPLSYSYLD